jgi:hypothetical protein
MSKYTHKGKLPFQASDPNTPPTPDPIIWNVPAAAGEPDATPEAPQP